jgi:hypothetical protein
VLRVVRFQRLVREGSHDAICVAVQDRPERPSGAWVRRLAEEAQDRLPARPRALVGERPLDQRRDDVWLQR